MTEQEELNIRAGEVETMRREHNRKQAETRELANGIIAEAREIQAQRDDLLAACIVARPYIFLPAVGHPQYDMAMTDYEQVNAAIAKAEGEQNDEY